MKRVFIFFLVCTFLIGLASSEVIINNQPEKSYNLGETVFIDLTVKSLNKISEILNMNLICNSKEINFYKNGVSLGVGEEKKIDSSLILTKNLIGESKGKCVIKITLGEDYYITDEFFISNILTIVPNVKTPSVSPGEKILIEGTAKLGSGSNANGFLNVSLKRVGDESNDTIEKLSTIDNGFFSLSFTASEDWPAGEYILGFYGYEKDLSETITNKGEAKTSIIINQIPRNLEIILDKDSIGPQETLTGSAILHDQTGLNIDSPLTIEIKDSKDKLLEKFEIRTSEEFTYTPLQGKSPDNLTIYAGSGEFSQEKQFKISQKQSISVEVINKTLIVTNTGNVEYCDKEVLIKIGSDSLNINPCIKTGGNQKYTLSAPDGEYEIEVITPDENIVASTILTGKSIGIKEASGGVANLTRHPFVWFFVLGVMAFITVTIFRKGYKRTFFSKMKRTPKTTSQKSKVSQKKEEKNLKLFSKNRAILSLSMTGERQKSTIIGLKIKNYADITHNPVGTKETFAKIESLSENEKSFIYENKENIFLILTPAKTRTFHNEKKAIDIARKIEDIIRHHNRLFKQKIEFGLGINTGDLVVKLQKDHLEFMSMGDTLTKTKKIASISNEQVLLDEKIRENLGAKIKTKKITHKDISAYTVEEMKTKDVESEKFIKRFVEKLERK